MRYIAASALALASDYGCFVLLLNLGVLSPVAAGGGYCLGILVHWMISSRFVFYGSMAQSAGRNVQKGLFIGSALVGLGITVGIVWFGHILQIDPRLSKLMAIIVSFQVTYLLRAKVVFR